MNVSERLRTEASAAIASGEQIYGSLDYPNELPIGSERFSPTRSIVTGSLLLLGMAVAALVIDSNVQNYITEMISNSTRMFSGSGHLELVRNFIPSTGLLLR